MSLFDFIQSVGKKKLSVYYSYKLYWVTIFKTLTINIQPTMSNKKCFKRIINITYLVY